MKLNLETKYNIFDEVRYKKMDTFLNIEIIESRITTIDIQVGTYGNICVEYGMENEDTVCSDSIIEVL